MFGVAEISKHVEEPSAEIKAELVSAIVIKAAATAVAACEADKDLTEENKDKWSLWFKKSCVPNIYMVFNNRIDIMKNVADGIAAVQKECKDDAECVRFLKILLVIEKYIKCEMLNQAGIKTEGLSVLEINQSFTNSVPKFAQDFFKTIYDEIIQLFSKAIQIKLKTILGVVWNAIDLAEQTMSKDEVAAWQPLFSEFADIIQGPFTSRGIHPHSFKTLEDVISKSNFDFSFKSQIERMKKDLMMKVVEKIRKLEKCDFSKVKDLSEEDLQKEITKKAPSIQLFLSTIEKKIISPLVSTKSTVKPKPVAGEPAAGGTPIGKEEKAGMTWADVEKLPCYWETMPNLQDLDNHYFIRKSSSKKTHCVYYVVDRKLVFKEGSAGIQIVNPSDVVGTVSKNKVDVVDASGKDKVVEMLRNKGILDKIMAEPKPFIKSVNKLPEIDFPIYKR